MSKKKDKLKGGYADGKSPEDIAKKHGVSVDKIRDQLKMGIKVEMEHVDDKGLSEEIALDHLYEIPDYYTRLNDMEKRAKEEMKEKGDVNEGKENITDFAKRMRELAGLSESQEKKTIKTIQEGESTFDGESMFMAKDFMTSNDKKEGEKLTERDLDINGNPIPAIDSAPINESEDKSSDEFETHKFEQKTIEEGDNDEELYQLDENTIIVLDFLDDEKEEKK